MNSLLQSLTLVDISGQGILLAIALVLVLSLVFTAIAIAHYRKLGQAISDAVPHQQFSEPVLNRILMEAQALARSRAGELDAQGIVEHNLQSEHGGLLVAERFVRAAPGLVIVLGLVGTFYGLTLSIGELSGLVSAENSGAGEMTLALTSGLTDALSGMSVAFTTSLAGILAAVILTIVGIFASVTDRRTSAMVQIENHLDRVIAPQFAAGPAGMPELALSGSGPEQMLQVVAAFGQAVGRLEGSVQHFDHALSTFSQNTRDFSEFNHHLKDNVQRMSLSFSDLSDQLRRTRDGRPTATPPGPIPTR